MSKSLKEILSAITLDANGKVENAGQLLETVLARLVSFDTTSSHDENIAKSNTTLMAEVTEALRSLGAEVKIKDTHYPKGIPQRTLVARMGPAAEGGLVLCGHTDVVPAGDRSKWKTEPFTLTRDGDKLIGRGAVDMKGSIASFLVAAAALHKRDEKLEKPLYFAFSWGEEIGCKGADDLVATMEAMQIRPEAVLVGEPTGGDIGIAHKGAMNLNFVFRGISGHSGYPQEAVSALDYGNEFMTWMKQLEKDLAAKFSDPRFDPPEPVINLNNAQSLGGDGPNAVDSLFRVGAHIRPTPAINVERDIFVPIRTKVAELEARMKAQAVAAAEVRAKRTGEPKETLSGTDKVGVTFNTLSVSLGLDAPTNPQNNRALKMVHQAYRDVHKTEGKESTLAYGTDGGRIAAWAHDLKQDILVFAFGRGSMAQHGHNPNEFITVEQLQQNLKLHDRLVLSFCGAKDLAAAPSTIQTAKGSAEQVITDPMKGIAI